MVHVKLFAVTILIISVKAWSAETIHINIGHQSTCTDTYTAGVIVQELKLLEKYLPKEGKYQGATFKINWQDYTSGPPITQLMLSNKLQFGVMGDYPLIVNGAKFQATKSLRTHYIAGTGYNLRGSGNAIVVPIDSDIQSIKDLVGKEMSMPVGSAAWGMTLKAFADQNIDANKVSIISQSPTIGAANIAHNKIDAHADFCPWPEIMEFRGTGRKIFDGSEANVAYLHGVVVREDFANKFPEIAVAFAKAIIHAGNWVKEDPVRAATELEEWTGIEKEVQYLYFSKGGMLTLDPTIKPLWIETLVQDHKVLAREKNLSSLDFNDWIDDQYIRQAFSELGLNYEQQLEKIVDPIKANSVIEPAEIWHRTRGILKYRSVSDMIVSWGLLNRESDDAIYSAYVYDKTTGVKMFAHVASFQFEKELVTAFMRKNDASGKVLNFEQAVNRLAHLSQ